MSDLYISVTTLTQYIKRKFDVDPYMQKIWIKGEISNFRPSQRGHLYFTLKDDKARIFAAMFNGQARQLDFEPADGTKVLVSGSVSVYEESGRYQLYVQEMMIDGTGNLFLAFQKLKQDLEKEGLFSDAKKKPLPSFPKHIAVLTSPYGAAVHDMVSTMKRRYPLVQITVIATTVQGEGAIPSLIRNLRLVQNDPSFSDVDVVIVGRGGGSIEELWAFNEEEVAREIAACSIPVISAVGHETDFTIADFVSDLRAPTPTGAAEMATPDIVDLMHRLHQASERLDTAIRIKLRGYHSRLTYLIQSYVLKNPKMTYLKKEERLDSGLERLHMVMRSNMQKRQIKLQAVYSKLPVRSFQDQIEHRFLEVAMYKKQLEAGLQYQLKQKQNMYMFALKQLEAYSPIHIMQRGFSIPQNETGEVIRSIDAIEISENFTLRLSDGQMRCTVTDKKPLSIH